MALADWTPAKRKTRGSVLAKSYLAQFPERSPEQRLAILEALFEELYDAGFSRGRRDALGTTRRAAAP